MNLSRRALLASAAALPAARPARAQKPVLKIGVLTDLSGPYKDIVGPLSVEAVKLAVADFAAGRSRGERNDRSAVELGFDAGDQSCD